MMHGIISVPWVEMIREAILTSAVTMIMVKQKNSKGKFFFVNATVTWRFLGIGDLSV